jgi:hypothetical protein
LQRALARGNLLVAEMTAREIGRVSLEDAVALTALIGQKDPRRLDAFAARWLRRYLDERAPVSAYEAALATAALNALRDPAAVDAGLAALRALIGTGPR